MPVYLDARHLPETQNIKGEWTNGTIYVEVDKDSSILADAPLGASVEVESREELLQHFNKDNEFFIRAFNPSDKAYDRPAKAQQLMFMRKFNDAICVNHNPLCRPVYLNELDAKGTQKLVNEAKQEAKRNHIESIEVNFPWLRLSSLEHRCINTDYVVAPDKEDKPHEKPLETWRRVLTASRLRNIALPYGVKAVLNRNRSVLEVDDEAYHELVNKAKKVMSREQKVQKVEDIVLKHFDWKTSNHHDGRFERILMIPAHPLRRMMDKYTGMKPRPAPKKDNHRRMESEDLFQEYMSECIHDKKSISKLFRNVIPIDKVKKDKITIEIVNVFMKDLQSLHEGYLKLKRMKEPSIIFGQKRRRGLISGIYAYPHHSSGDRKGWRELFMDEYIEKQYPGWEMYKQYKKYSDYVRSYKDSNTMKWIEECIRLLDPVAKMKPI
jgi:hypothetical protein